VERVPETVFHPIKRASRNLASFTPVSDRTFRSYIDNLYKYDRTELRAVVESVDESSEHWRQEKVMFDGTYSNERVTAYLLLPKRTAPPYQTVAFFPGAGVIDQQSSENLRYEAVFGLIVESGRAVIYPIYKGTYERRADNVTKDRWRREHTISFRDWVIQLSKDLRRSIDYLETRDDIDTAKLAYFGLSWGAAAGPIMVATEERFKTGIFLCGGLYARERLPAADAVNFAPRVKIPVLMVNGRDDSFFPLEMSQKPLFDLLGTPAEEKKHVVYPGGHFITWQHQKKAQREILDWLDRHLGQVNYQP
jgi:dienelactone hydrolase